MFTVSWKRKTRIARQKGNSFPRWIAMENSKSIHILYLVVSSPCLPPWACIQFWEDGRQRVGCSTHLFLQKNLPSQRIKQFFCKKFILLFQIVLDRSANFLWWPIIFLYRSHRQERGERRGGGKINGIVSKTRKHLGPRPAGWCESEYQKSNGESIAVILSVHQISPTIVS